MLYCKDCNNKILGCLVHTTKSIGYITQSNYGGDNASYHFPRQTTVYSAHVQLECKSCAKTWTLPNCWPLEDKKHNIVRFTSPGLSALGIIIKQETKKNIEGEPSTSDKEKPKKIAKLLSRKKCLRIAST